MNEVQLINIFCEIEFGYKNMYKYGDFQKGSNFIYLFIVWLTIMIGLGDDI